MEQPKHRDPARHHRMAVTRALAFGLPLLLFAVVLLRTAWLCDDAYITLRTVDNALDGHGLRWNVGERVQSYTHPLWMSLLLAAVGVTREFYYTPLALAAALSLLALCVLAGRIARSAALGAAGIGALCLSQAFVEYSSSGLENPLLHALLGLFIVAATATTATAPARRATLQLSLLTALGTLTRPDAVLLFAPALALEVARRRRLGELSLGLAPLLAWAIFALVYYGTPLPNTAYAKLSGLGLSERVAQGAGYFAHTLSSDPITLVGIALGLAVGLRAPAQRPIALGIVLYLGYVVVAGGDFMQGRFLTAPLYAAIALATTARVERVRSLHLGLGLAAATLVALQNPGCPLRVGPDYGAAVAPPEDPLGPGDERAFYYQATGLLRPHRRGAGPAGGWAREGRAARKDALALRIWGAVGIRAFYAGPGVHVIDLFGIVDPLVARLPPRPGRFRPGHVKREIPSGYVETVLTGDNRIEDAALARYYERLRCVVSCAIWSTERWRAIGPLLRSPRAPGASSATWRKLAANADGELRLVAQDPGIYLGRLGLRLVAKAPLRAESIELEMAHGRPTRVDVVQGKRVVHRTVPTGVRPGVYRASLAALGGGKFSEVRLRGLPVHEGMSLLRSATLK